MFLSLNETCRVGERWNTWPMTTGRHRLARCKHTRHPADAELGLPPATTVAGRSRPRRQDRDVEPLVGVEALVLGREVAGELAAGTTGAGAGSASAQAGTLALADSLAAEALGASLVTGADVAPSPSAGTRCQRHCECGEQRYTSTSHGNLLIASDRARAGPPPRCRSLPNGVSQGEGCATATPPDGRTTASRRARRSRRSGIGRSR
jgi:hypothetical protein